MKVSCFNRRGVGILGKDLGFPLLLYLIVSILPLQGQDQIYSASGNQIVIERLTGGVNFDGVPDEKVWFFIEPVSLVMYSPHFGQKSSEQSEVRFGFDDNYLYIGAILMCDDLSLIRSASLKRDFFGQGGDMFGIILDTYNDKENGLMFFTTPDALRIDGTIQRDAMVSNSNKLPYNLSWNTFWDVKTTKNEYGWSVEMQIPLSGLRFQVNGEAAKMGIIIQRWIPAKNELDIYPTIPPNWGQYSVYKPSQAMEVLFNGIKSSKPLYLAPYTLAGFERNYVSDENGEGYHASDNPVLDAGLDLKYGISSNLVLDLTVNTDFAQVETDDQQINLTRYSLYYPEKRLFFLERSSAFDFSFGGNNNVFYSRRIGLSEEGQPVRIYGGARLTGRIGKWEIGLLDMQTVSYTSAEEEETVFPSENFSALRLRRQIINSNSFMGAMITGRLGTDGHFNFVYGVDGLVRIFGEDYIDLKIARSSESDINEISLKSPSRVYALWERRAKVGLGYALGLGYVGSEYNPGIGFERQTDYGNYRFDLSYGWLPGPASVLYRHAPELDIRYFYYANDGSLMTYETKALWEFETKNKWKGESSIEYKLENLKDSLHFSGDEIFVTPARYNNMILSLDVTTPDSRPLYSEISVETGRYYQGIRFSFKLQPTWNTSRYLELGSTYSFDYLNFSIRNQIMRNHIVGIKALVMLDTRLSFNGFIQYNTGDNLISSNIRLRYNPKEGNDIYLVFNEGRNYDLDLELPRLPKYRIRSVLLKYTYTFTL